MPVPKTTRPLPTLPQRQPRRTKPAPLTLFSAAAFGGTEQAPCGASSPIPASSRDVKPADGLVGIARLAASSPLARQKCGTEYFVLPVRSILNRCDSPRMPFRWTVNPYRGCEFGCLYCYARYTHEYMELDGGEFERKIFVKENAGPRMEWDLANKDIGEESIAIGTATNPYQPAEREFGVTRAILERMAEREGLNFSITTKSDRIVQDLDLLRAIAERSTLFVNMTVITLRPGLARQLEPRAPRPDLRLRAVERLREAGITTGIHVMPVVPGITDRQEDLDAVACAAKSAGAQWLAVGVLFLMPAARKKFLPFVEKKYPRLAAQYRAWYSRAAYPPESYRAEIASRADALRKKYGLGTRPVVKRSGSAKHEQFSLALG